jgi:hypothetical protein
LRRKAHAAAPFPGRDRQSTVLEVGRQTRTWPSRGQKIEMRQSEKFHDCIQLSPGSLHSAFRLTGSGGVPVQSFLFGCLARLVTFGSGRYRPTSHYEWYKLGAERRENADRYVCKFHRNNGASGREGMGLSGLGEHWPLPQLDN